MTLTSRTPGSPEERREAFPVYLINNYLVKTEHAMELMTWRGFHVKGVRANSYGCWQGRAQVEIHKCRLYFWVSDCVVSSYWAACNSDANQSSRIFTRTHEAGTITIHVSSQGKWDNRKLITCPQAEGTWQQGDSSQMSSNCQCFLFCVDVLLSMWSASDVECFPLPSLLHPVRISNSQ